MNKFSFIYNVDMDNTLTNDPSLTLLVEVKVLTFKCSDEPTLVPEVVAGEYTNTRGARDKFPTLSTALVIRIKNWMKVYMDITRIAEEKYHASVQKNAQSISHVNKDLFKEMAKVVYSGIVPQEQLNAL